MKQHSDFPHVKLPNQFAKPELCDVHATRRRRLFAHRFILFHECNANKSSRTYEANVHYVIVDNNIPNEYIVPQLLFKRPLAKHIVSDCRD